MVEAPSARTPKESSRRRRIREACEDRCWFCGDDLTDTWSVEHLEPRSRGGANELHNMVAACRTCNGMKGSMALPEFRVRLAKMLDVPKIAFSGERRGVPSWSLFHGRGIARALAAGHISRGRVGGGGR